MLPVEDVEVLDDLPDRDLGDGRHKCVTCVSEDDVARDSGKGPERVDQDEGETRKNAVQSLDVAQVGKQLIDQGAIHQVGAEPLVPDDGVQEARAEEQDEQVRDDPHHLENVASFV